MVSKGETTMKIKIYQLIKCLDGTDYKVVFESTDLDEVEHKLDIAEASNQDFTFVSYDIGYVEIGEGYIA